MLSIVVDKQGFFDTHSPVIFKLQIPSQQICRQTFRFPSTWISLPVEKNDLEEALQFTVELHGNPTTLEEWGQFTENLVDQALRNTPNAGSTCSWNNGLPKKYRGRCKPRKLVEAPWPAQAKFCSLGGSDLPAEATSMISRSMTKQLRRIASFRSRLHKIQSYPIIWHRTILSLGQEWNAICKYSFKGALFHEWLLSIPELQPVPDYLPTHEWICLLEQFFKHELHSKVNQERKLTRDLVTIDRHTDQKFGHSRKAFRVAKGKALPPFRTVSATVSDDGIIAAMDDPNMFEIFLSSSSQFQAGTPIMVDEHVGSLCCITVHSLQVKFAEPPTFADEEVHVEQMVTKHDLSSVFESLSNFWNQYWQRNDVLEEDSFSESDIQTLQEIQSIVTANNVEIPNAERNLEAWTEAIRTNKKSSAPGCDGITFSELAELPEQVIAMLMNIVADLPAFPSWFMLSRTKALPKKLEKPTAADSRPITIMATIYRLWSKVTCRAILKVLANQLPLAITGMVPGRGAFDASYMLQTMLELAGKKQQSIEGVTLDLRKCFNLMARKKIRLAFEALRLPVTLIDKWYNSLTSLCRFWEIDGNCSRCYSSTAGCPEGDSWSVLAMISVAWCWVSGILKFQPNSDASAYADNWSWWTNNPDNHAHIAAHTQKICTFFGLEIDWGKTWMWATHQNSCQILENILRQYTCQLPSLVRCATDLGCPVTYHGTELLGKLLTRFEQAKSRLSRIQFAQWDLDVKIHVIIASVFAVAFYGAELVPVGVAHLNSLRSCIANSILGDKSRSCNPAILLNFAHHKLVDPNIFVVLQAVQKARRFLLKCDALIKREFLKIVATPVATTGKAHGPAGTLREYLLRIGLQCDSLGNIFMTHTIRCNLLTSSMRTLRNFLLDAWQDDFFKLQTQRTKLFHFPKMARVATIQTLAKYPPKERLRLLREISGSYQTRSQQATWDPDTPDICQWCKCQRDTKWHRLGECTAFAEYREPFSHVIQYLEEHQSPWIEIPVLFENTDDEIITHMHYSMPSPEISESLIENIQNTFGTQQIVAFTDGSCQHPAMMSSRYAAYSIVIDLCTSEHQRQEEANQFLLNGSMPETLQLLGVARLQGAQNILRAELSAILEVFRLFDNILVYTDSAASISAIEKVTSATSVLEFADHSEFDLLVQFHQLDLTNRKVQKIKAHLDPRETHDSSLRYRQLGNQMANDEAIKARDQLLKPAVTLFEKRFEERSEDISLLKDLYNLHLVLQTARAKAIVHDDEQNNNTSSTQQSKQIRDFVASTTWQFPENIDDSWLQYSAWGKRIMMSMLGFLLQCRWDDDSKAPAGLEMGFSWTEFAISLALHHGMWLPVKRQHSDGNTYIVQPKTIAEAQALGIDLAEQTKSCNAIYQQFQGLMPQNVVPKIRMGKVRSLLTQGFTGWTTGLSHRPQHPYQCEVFDSLQQYFPTMTGWLGGLPTVHFSGIFEMQQDEENFFRIPWEKSIMKTRSTFVFVRRSRKET